MFTPYLAYKTRQEEEKSEQSQFVNTQIELMRSPLVLERLVGKPEIAALPEVRRMKEPVKELRDVDPGRSGRQFPAL